MHRNAGKMRVFYKTSKNPTAALRFLIPDLIYTVILADLRTVDLSHGSV